MQYIYRRFCKMILSDAKYTRRTVLHKSNECILFLFTFYTYTRHLKPQAVIDFDAMANE